METPKSIITVEGEATYLKTEVEVKGKWNDNYSVRDGFYLLHEGDKHHVYKLTRKPLLFS